MCDICKKKSLICTGKCMIYGNHLLKLIIVHLKMFLHGHYCGIILIHTGQFGGLRIIYI